MCIIFNILTPHPEGPPIEHPKPDPTKPSPSPSPSPTPTPSPTPMASALSGSGNIPFPDMGARLSAFRAHALSMAISEVFQTIAKIETSFISYTMGKIGHSENEFCAAIKHAQEIQLWLGKIESSTYEQVRWYNEQPLPPENDKAVKGVKHEDISSDLLLHFAKSAKPDEVSNNLLQAVQKEGFRGVLNFGKNEVSQLRALARDVIASFEIAETSIRKGELFEAFLYRVDKTFLETKLTELASGLLLLGQSMNYVASLTRAGAAKISK